MRWAVSWSESESGVGASHIEEFDTQESVVEVNITGDDAAWLAEFATSLVNDRLAACANLISQVRSVYRWQGRIEDSSEALAVLHTRRSLVDRIVERADSDHPYDVPQVVVKPIVTGHAAYLEWVRAETAPEPARRAPTDDRSSPAVPDAAAPQVPHR
ncbi:divalent-cation tolerance protein CutA [Skermania piniformis]|uniref:Divalent-cation tolerance protein CutA n=1 Tax=Skermania pinensis TaxID=39122 RepID=A0ABX8SAG1_9ACTN|nr:divalent-cation tolerance protein CutA [Skermania piniformis]